MLCGIMLTLPLLPAGKMVLLGMRFKEVLLLMPVLVLVLFGIHRLLADGTAREGDDGFGRSDGTKAGTCSQSILPYRWLLIAGLLCLYAWISHLRALNGNSIRYVYYIAGLLLLCFLPEVPAWTKRLSFHIVAVPVTILYGFVIFRLITGLKTPLRIEQLAARPGELTPLLLLGCAVTSVLYLLHRSERYAMAFAALSAVGYVLFFFHGDMVAFFLLGLFLLSLPLCFNETLGILKKSLIQLLIFGLAASNTALLTYFSLKGSGDRTFSLENSIYIDLVIAVTGLFVSRYLDRFAEDADPQTEIPGMHRAYRTLRYAVIVGTILLLMTAKRLSGMSPKWGLDAVQALATGLQKATEARQGEWLPVLSSYGLIGLAVPCVLAGAILYTLWQRRQDADRMQRLWGLMMVLFIAQSIFYRFYPTSFYLWLFLPILAMRPADIQVSEDGLEFVRLEETAEGMADGFAVKIKRRLPSAGQCRSAFLVTIEAVCAAALVVLLFPVAWQGVKAWVGGDERLPLTLFAQEHFLPLRTESEDSRKGEQWEDVVRRFYGVMEMGYATSELAEETASEAEEIPAGISGGDYRIYDPNASYRPVSDTVTAGPGGINLRSIPSIEEDAEILYELRENETVARIAIGENGWSRLRYRGQICYAATEYLRMPQEQAEETSVPEEAQPEEVPEAMQEPEAAGDETSVQQEQTQTQEQAQTQERKAYTLQLGAGDTECVLWSSGVKQGTLAVTDGENHKIIRRHADHIIGRGEEQRKYLGLSVAVEEGDPPVQMLADNGFIAALKDMGYSGVYFNGQVINW